MSNTIEWRTVEHRGVKVHVYVVADDAITPDHADCYTDADKAAWRMGNWRYVGMIVKLAGCESLDASLWGVEYGDAPEWSQDMDGIVRDYVPDLCAEILPQIGTLATQLDTVAKLWGAQ